MKYICDLCEKEIGYNDSPYHDIVTDKYYHTECLKIRSFILNNKNKVRQILKGDKENG